MAWGRGRWAFSQKPKLIWSLFLWNCSDLLFFLSIQTNSVSWLTVKPFVGHFEPEAFKKDSLADQNLRKTPADFPLLFTIVDKFFIPLWFSACACNSLGSLSMFCRSRDGQCQCRRKFQGQKCNECRIGFYDFPRCKACGCNPAGIKLLPGQTNGCGSVNNVRIRWLDAEFFLS